VRTKRDEADLRAAFERGRRAWPGLNLDQDLYARRLSTEIAAADLARRAEDIYLALACVWGNPCAHRLFDDCFLSQVPAFVRPFHLAPHLVDEVRQRVRIKQLLGAQPGLSQYRGRGPLAAWVRTIAVRVACDVATHSAKVARDTPGAPLDAWGPCDDGPETRTIRNLYRPTLSRALEDSLACLDARDKKLLCLNVIDHRNVDDIGRDFGVHRATAARWLTAIRRRVFDGLQARAALHWGISTSELRELVVMMGDELDVSLTPLTSSTPSTPSTRSSANT